MINTGDIAQLDVLLSMLNVPTGGGGGGSVTQSEVQRSAFNYAPATGANDAFVVTLNPVPGSLTNGLLITMTTGALENTTNNPTLKVNTIAAKPIVLWAGGLAPGDMQANGAYIFVYSTQEDVFYLINPSVSTANSFLTQANAYNSFIDAGAADAYVGTLSIQSDATLSSGFTVLMQASAENTGASTLTINGDTLPIVFEGGTGLTAGVIVANQIYSLIYSLTFDSWVLLNPKNTSTVLTLANNSNTLPSSFSLGSLTNGLLKIGVSSSIATVSNAINSTDYWAPNDVITLPGFPSNSNDASSKGYVDSVVAGLNPVSSCYGASTGDLAGYSYNNGASGVGATLTAGSNGAFTQDGLTIPVDERWLYKDDTNGSGAYNGVYVLTTTGDASNPSVLTRAENYDTPENINSSGVVPILFGTLNAGTGWINSSVIVTVGVSPIVYIQFGGLTGIVPGALGGTGIANTGKTITIGGNLSTIGAFTSDFTMTGNTAVTFPTSGTLATTASASGIVNSGLINQLTWYAATGTTVSGLATANNGLLVTSAAGVPSIGNAILANISINSIQAGRGTSNVVTNTVFGVSSGNALTATSNSNAFFGYIAGTVVTDGIGNALFGSVSGGHLTTGSFNTYVGRSAGESDGALNINTTTAESCTFVGFSCGSGSADAIGCISLGRQANSNKATGTTSGTIGPGIAIGSTAFPVGVRGDGTVYPGSMWRPKINGTFYMVPLLTDGATATGTGNLVLATSPTLVTPVIGAATGTSLTTSGAITATAAQLSSGLATGGFTGNLVLYPSTSTRGLFQLLATNNVANQVNTLTNAATSANRTWTLPDASGTITVLGNAVTGSGSIVLATSPTLVTPVLGVATGTSLALSGALSADSASFTSALTGANGGTGVANTGKTITIGGNLSTVGAFTAEFTMTADTAVTFPTSGTLATTATASGIINSGLINQLAFYAADGTTLSGVTTANNGLLVTSAAGVPSIGNDILANIAVNGVQVGRGAANVASNVFIGTAGNAAATGTDNQAVSSSTCFQNLTTGASNTGMGSNVFSAITVGGFNVCVGLDAGRSMAASNNNVIIGAQAGDSYVGFSSVMIGRAAGFSMTSSNNSVVIGLNAGRGAAAGSAAIITGTINTLIGANASGNASTASGLIALGAEAVALGATGVGSGANGPGIAIGSDLHKVGFRGDGTMYPGNMWRPRINGATYMVPLLVDGSTSTGTGNLVLATSPTLVTPVLGVATATSLVLSGALSAGSASFTAALPVLSGGTGVTTSTGSGSNVLSTSPTLVTPALGTPTSGVLTNCTGLVATTGLTATGTKDSTTFLRGDNTFAVPASGSGNAKAWVNFNGVGTPAIRASFGVASVTSVSTAVYEINFSVAFSAANYGYSFGCGRAGLGGGFMIEGPAVAPTTTAFRCGTFNASFSANAAPYVGASFFGA